jgi:replicative DNA helicase
MRSLTPNECERLNAAFVLRGIEATRLLLNNGVEAEHFADNEIRVVMSAAFSLAIAGTETSALEILRHVTEKASDEEIKIFTGANRKDRLETFSRLLDRLIFDFPHLSCMTTPEGAAAFVKSEATRRTVVNMAREFYTSITNGANVSDTITGTIAELLKVNSILQHVDGIETLASAAKLAQHDAEEEAAGRVKSLSTGYRELDIALHGLKGGRLYVIGAEEKCGKSLLTSAIGFNVARAGAPVGLVSMEMQGKEIAARLAGCSETEPANERAAKLAQFSNTVFRYPFFIRSGGVTAARLTAAAYELVLKNRVQLLIVDYLQLVSMSGKVERVNEINETVAGLKSFAMAFNIPVVLVSSVNNKQIIGRTSKKPTPADLRDSGRIANDCDCLIFLWTPSPDIAPAYREVFISRGRNGESGTIGLNLNASSLRFEETPLQYFIEPKQHSQAGRAWD